MEIQNLTLSQGSTWDIDVAVTGPDGTPMDLTGYSVRSQVRLTAKDPQPKAAFTCATPVGNVVRLHLTAAQTAAIAPGKYGYDVEIYRTEGLEEIVHRTTSGIITVTAEMTK